MKRAPVPWRIGFCRHIKAMSTGQSQETKGKEARHRFAQWPESKVLGRVWGTASESSLLEKASKRKHLAAAVRSRFRSRSEGNSKFCHQASIRCLGVRRLG